MFRCPSQPPSDARLLLGAFKPMGKRLWDVIGQAQPQQERLPLGEVGKDNRPDWIAGYRPGETQRPRRYVGDCGKCFEEFSFSAMAWPGHTFVLHAYPPGRSTSARARR